MKGRRRGWKRDSCRGWVGPTIMRDRQAHQQEAELELKPFAAHFHSMHCLSTFDTPPLPPVIPKQSVKQRREKKQDALHYWKNTNSTGMNTNGAGIVVTFALSTPVMPALWWRKVPPAIVASRVFSLDDARAELSRFRGGEGPGSIAAVLCIRR